MSYIYLATPYTHKSPEIQSERFHAALNYVVKMLEAEPYHSYYAPIVYYHHAVLKHSLRTDAEFWQTRNEDMISGCKELHVLCLAGWRMSKGIKLEVAYAQSIGKRVVYLTP